MALSQNGETIFHTDFVYIYHYGDGGVLLDLPGILIGTEDSYHPQVCQNFHLMKFLFLNISYLLSILTAAEKRSIFKYSKTNFNQSTDVLQFICK